MLASIASSFLPLSGGTKSRREIFLNAWRRSSELKQIVQPPLHSKNDLIELISNANPDTIGSGSFGDVHGIDSDLYDARNTMVVKFVTNGCRNGVNEAMEEAELSLRVAAEGVGPMVYGAIIMENLPCHSAILMENFNEGNLKKYMSSVNSEPDGVWGSIKGFFLGDSSAANAQQIVAAINTELPKQIDALTNIGISCYDIKAENMLVKMRPDGTLQIVLSDFDNQFCTDAESESLGKETKQLLTNLQRLSMALMASAHLTKDLSSLPSFDNRCSYGEVSKTTPCVLVNYITRIFDDLACPSCPLGKDIAKKLTMARNGRISASDGIKYIQELPPRIGEPVQNILNHMNLTLPYYLPALVGPQSPRKESEEAARERYSDRFERFLTPFESFSRVPTSEPATHKAQKEEKCKQIMAEFQSLEKILVENNDIDDLGAAIVRYDVVWTILEDNYSDDYFACMGFRSGKEMKMTTDLYANAARARYERLQQQQASMPRRVSF